MLDTLIRYCLQHLDITILALSTILATIIPLIITGITTLTQHGGNTIHTHIKKKRNDKKGKREEKARLGRAEELLQQYTANLQRHPDISQVRIMGMKQPLKLLDIYVHLYIHSETVVEPALVPALREAEEILDPNALFEITQRSLEESVDKAIKPEDAIRQHRLCVIVGGPGAGKTTLLRYLALKSASHELVDLPSLPLYVQLNTFNPSVHKDLLGLIMDQLDESYDTPETRDLLREKMNQGQVLLLLDGLDETKIGNAEDKDRTYAYMIDAIKKLATNYASMPIVVTVRKAGYQYHEKLPNFYELEVTDFRLEDSKTFVSRWFSATNTSRKTEKIRDLNMQLERNLRIRAIASNPLLLSLIITVYEAHMGLPDGRAKLYEQCVEVLQTKWDASHDIQRRRTFPLIFQPQLLQEVAWHFHNKGMRYFPKQELLHVIGEFLPSADMLASQREDVLVQIAIDDGLLREQAHGWYGFSHLTFQEYFVVQYIIVHNKQEELIRHIDNPWWEEVLLLYAGASSKKHVNELLTILLGHDLEHLVEDDMFQTHLLLAGRCLSEKLLVDINLREKITSNLFTTLLTTTYTCMREQCANTLAMIGKPRINNRLLQLLADTETDGEVQKSIGYALTHHGERILAADLAHLLEHAETSRYIRIIVARALGVLGGQDIIDLLLRVLVDDHKDSYVRQSVALTLGMLGDPKIVPALLKMLETMIDTDDKNVVVQQGTIIALGMLKQPEIVDTLYSWLTNDKLDWYVRGSIARALGMLDIPATVPMLLKLLQDNTVNSYVRQRVASTLILFTHTKIPVEPLFAMLRDRVVNPGVRASVAGILGCIGTVENIPALLTLLQDESNEPEVRGSIATTLRYMDLTHTDINTLHTLRRKPQLDHNIYGSITATLGLLGEHSVVHDLVKLVRASDTSHDVLLLAAHALSNLSIQGHIDKYEIASELSAMLALPDLDRYKGHQIVKVLHSMSEPSVVPALLSLLANRAIDHAIRQSIASAIAHLANDRMSVDQLTLQLADSDIKDDIYCALWVVSRRMKQKNSNTLPIN